MAKQLLEKNRHKVGDVVSKATEKVDKVSGGKTSNLSKKAEEAARKYSAGSSATHHGAHPDAVTDSYNDGYSGGSLSREEAELRRVEAQTKATTAVTGLMNAANGFIGKAQAKIDAQGSNLAAPDPATASVSDPTNPPPIDAPPPLPES